MRGCDDCGDRITWKAETATGEVVCRPCLNANRDCANCRDRFQRTEMRRRAIGFDGDGRWRVVFYCPDCHEHLLNLEALGEHVGRARVGDYVERDLAETLLRVREQLK